MSSLLRSTKFVRYFTGAARTLILNSAKTAEANLFSNPKALCSANNVLMRDYATSKKSESLEPLLQKLDSEVRRYGRITKRDIDEVLDEIKAKNDITSSQSLLVIRCCGELVPEEPPEQRTLLVQKIWNVLTERGVPMDISHYNALLRVYLENEHPFSPAQFLEELEKKGLQPNRVTYQRLMWRYCQEGDVEGATRVLEKMRELNFPVSEPVLNALVMGHAFHGDTEGAKAVLETMAGAGLQPTNKTYALLACGYAKEGNIEQIKNIIQTAADKDTFLSDKDLLDIVEHLTISGHGNQVEEIFPHLQRNIGYNQDVCNLILKLLNKGYEDVAKKVMKTMPKSPNSDDTPFKGAFFIKQLLKVNKPAESIIKTCRELAQEELVPSAVYIATECALVQGKTELAQQLFKELQKDGYEIRQHYYWPLLAQKGKEQDEEGLLQILRNMASEGISPNGESLRDYVIPYLIKKDSPQNIILKLQIANVPVIHAARNLVVELLDNGNISEAANIAAIYRPRGQYSLIARALLNAFGKTKDIDSFVSILHVISSHPPTTQNDEQSSNDDGQVEERDDSSEIGRIVKTAIRNLQKPELAEKLLVALHDKGLRIDIPSAEAIEQSLGQNMTTKLSELLSKLTSTNLEPAPLETIRRDPLPRNSANLENLLAQAKNKGTGNVIRLQRQLLTVYINENNVGKVTNLYKELESANYDFTPTALAQLFEFYCQNDDINTANEMEVKLKSKDPKFVLNKFKVIQMAFALIRANRHSEAVEYLKTYKPLADDDTSGFIYNSKCWQLLNHLAERKETDMVKQVTKILIDNNYVEPSNVVLGPSIKVHLLQEDTEGALKEFEHCCKQYRSTPWKGELMKALIMKEDAGKLQWLADISTQIHGEVNILHDLVLAFVECGRLRQARRILETPGLHARPRRLQDACQRYRDEGKSEYLEGLLEATKELSHIDRSDIFYQLLVTYCKANETDKALGLWTLLQEEDQVPSKEFLMYLGTHLRAKNRPIPFVMPEQLQTAKPKKQKSDKVQQPPKPSNINKISKQDLSTEIEELIHQGKSDAAATVVLKRLEEGTIAKPNILKYLLKNLAEQGNVEKIESIGKKLNESMKRNVTYDDKLTLAIFKKGEGAQHVERVLQLTQAAHTDDQLELALRQFPRSTALASVMDDPEVVGKCIKIVDIAASKGQYLPANLLWMEYLLKGNEKEADELWNKWLSKSTMIVFRRLLQEGHVRGQPELLEKLVSCLQSNKSLTTGSLGNAYSRLINLHLANNNLEEAKNTLQKALKNGVALEQINKNSVTSLRTALTESGQTLQGL